MCLLEIQEIILTQLIIDRKKIIFIIQQVNQKYITILLF
jgi:hypothetical protein